MIVDSGFQLRLVAMKKKLEEIEFPHTLRDEITAIDMSRSNLSKIPEAVSVFSNLEELNLKNTRITSVGSIKDSEIRKLNLSGTVIYDSYHLLRIGSLEELVVGKNTLEDRVLKTLKKKIKVIIN